MGHSRDKGRVEVGILYFPSPAAYAYIYTEMLNNFICRNIVLFPPSKNVKLRTVYNEQFSLA